MKKFYQEFKKFITRGNAMDMAVGAVIGAAFTAIVTSLTNGILKPFINWIIYLICGGNSDALEKIYTILVPAYITKEDNLGNVIDTIDLSNSIYIDWGGLITAIFNFLIVAVVLFIVIKLFNYAKDFQENINDIKKIALYKQSKGMKLNKYERKALDEFQQAQAEEASKKEEIKEPTTNELLTEIIALMKDSRDNDIK